MLSRYTYVCILPTFRKKNYVRQVCQKAGVSRAILEFCVPPRPSHRPYHSLLHYRYSISICPLIEDMLLRTYNRIIEIIYKNGMTMSLLPGQKLTWSFSSFCVSLPPTFINDNGQNYIGSLALSPASVKCAIFNGLNSLGSWR